MDVRTEEIPEDLADLAAEYREKLMDALSNFSDESMEQAEIYRENLMDAISTFDDEIAMLYLEGEEVPVDMIKAVIRKATIANEMVPVVCGTSYKNKGVQMVLDAVVD